MVKINNKEVDTYYDNGVLKFEHGHGTHILLGLGLDYITIIGNAYTNKEISLNKAVSMCVEYGVGVKDFEIEFKKEINNKSIEYYNSDNDTSEDIKRINKIFDEHKKEVVDHLLLEFQYRLTNLTDCLFDEVYENVYDNLGTYVECESEDYEKITQMMKEEVLNQRPKVLEYLHKIGKLYES